MDNNKAYPFNSDRCVPVGEVLCGVLFELGLSFSDIANTLGIPLEQFRDSVYGRANLTSGLAKGLETITNVPAGFWLRLDEIYRKNRNSGDWQTGEDHQTSQRA